MMLRTIIGLAAIPVTAAPLAAQDQDPLAEPFATIGGQMKDQGATETGWQQRGTLAQGGSAVITVKLKDGASFAIAGVCDAGCANINMLLNDARGPVDEDMEDDNFPIVVANKPGTYTLRVVMERCSTATCAYGVKAYRQP
jgi:hypothetical protein